MSTASLFPSEANAFKANRARNLTASEMFPGRFRSAFESADNDDSLATVMVDSKVAFRSWLKILKLLRCVDYCLDILLSDNY